MIALQIAVIVYVLIGAMLSLWMAGQVDRLSKTDIIKLIIIPFIWFPLAITEIQKERRRQKGKSQERQL